MKALVMYNPRSGKGRFKRKLNRVKEVLTSKGYDDITIFESVHPKSITDYIKANLSETKTDILLVSGGDGTLNEAINGLMTLPFKMRPRLLYFPTGTINDVGHMFGLSYGFERTLALIDDSNLVLWDVCQINGDYFDYVSGIGKYTRASYQTNHPKLKKFFGVFYYVIEAFKEIRRKYEIELTIKSDGEEISGKYCLMLAMNTSRLGALYISSDEAQLDDGVITVYLFDCAINTRIFTMVNFFLSGGKELKGITKIRGKEFTIKTNRPVSYNVDGEKGRKLDHATISVERKAIPIYVSKNAKKTYFINQL